MPPLTLIPGAMAALAATGGIALALTLLGGGPAPASPAILPPAATTPERVVRVRLIRRAAEISLDDPAIRIIAGNEGAGKALLGARALRAEGGIVVVTGERGEIGRATEVGLTHPSGVRAGGRVLPVRVRVRAAGAGLEAVADVPLETYVAGVVSAEMFAHWPDSALEAQSIAARSYALHECTRAGARTWDLDGTSAHQEFASGASDAAAAAARRTRGLVLVYEGEVLRAYYSSTCGGRAASARDQWGVSPATMFNDVPPLRAHERLCPCNDAPRYRWRVIIPAAELRDRLRAYGLENGLRLAEVGTLRRCEVIERNDVDRPAKYRVVDDAGRAFELRAESMRLACNATVTEPEEWGGPPSVPPPPDLPGSLSGSVLGARAEPGAPRAEAWSNDFEVRISRGEATVEGRGFGHGVGLCQYGSRKLADEGWSAERILRHYYPGAAVAPAP